MIGINLPVGQFTDALAGKRRNDFRRSRKQDVMGSCRQKKSFLTACSVLLLMSITALKAQTEQEAVKEATLIFRGTVTKLQSVTMPEIPISDKTIVVRVEAVIDRDQAQSKSEPIYGFVGREVTVRIKDPQQFAVGRRIIFYAKGWLLGDGIAVQEVGHRRLPMTGSVSNSVLQNIERASRTAENELTMERIRQADLVILGKVISTEPVEVEPTPAESSPKSRVIDEHDPQLRRALVEVLGVDFDRQSLNPKNVRILFPASKDILWITTPRFERGDVGLFILKKAEDSSGLKRFVESEKVRIRGIENDYFAPDPLDFQPQSEADQIKALIKQINKQ